MNRNVESHFSELPQVDLQRSIFDRSSTHKLSLNVGDLVPFYIDEVLPGDTFNITTSKVVRLQTLLTPVMDNLYADFYWFYCPSRILWSHWKEFQGENTQSAWIPSTTYQIPAISSPATTGFESGTIADYLGLPVGVTWTANAKHSPSALPFRMYAKICDEFFRDENVTDPLYIPTGDSNQTGSNGSNYIYDVANGGMPFKVARYHDYFSSCLPNSQKASQPVKLPNQHINGYNGLSVYPGADEAYEAMETEQYFTPLRFYTYDYSSSTQSFSPSSTVSQPSFATRGSGSAVAIFPNSADLSNGGSYVIPANLRVDVPGSTITGININELRLAFQLQKYYERNARGGTRYQEILLSHFGVHGSDARLQRPEYLGGNRVPVTIHEVLNNSQSDQDFLGDLGAMSVTADVHDDVSQSFTEHGYIMGLMCLRYDNTYTQGLERFWSRKLVTDFYLPVFSNIGEQPVMSCELYANSTTLDSDDVFGYQEAWADYRYKPSRCSGEMRPGISNTLASWHFGDYYSQKPTLSDSWMRVDKTNVDRALAVTSSVSNQAFADIYIKNICTRCMPVYSIPGLIDHN